MYKVLTGAQMYSVRTLTQTQEGLDATLKALKEMGYTSVQLSGQNPALDPSAVRDALDKYGLICPATHTSFTESGRAHRPASEVGLRSSRRRRHALPLC